MVVLDEAHEEDTMLRTSWDDQRVDLDLVVKLHLGVLDRVRVGVVHQHPLRLVGGQRHAVLGVPPLQLGTRVELQGSEDARLDHGSEHPAGGRNALQGLHAGIPVSHPVDHDTLVLGLDRPRDRARQRFLREGRSPRHMDLQLVLWAQRDEVHGRLQQEVHADRAVLPPPVFLPLRATGSVMVAFGVAIVVVVVSRLAASEERPEEGDVKLAYQGFAVLPLGRRDMT
mmetsp:Transcript_59154/g.152128  ORF Transcript_59154/g.152128 Transcript_59154/m.152128 type:complete len:227 (+) Transcript_59154:881-1561(+)